MDVPLAVPAALTPAAVSHDFDTVARTEYRALVATAWAIVGDQATAEDLTQGALEKAYRRWDTISRYDRPGAWLRTVVTRDAISKRRRARNELRALSKVFSRRRNDVELPTEVVAFWDAVRSFEPQRRQVVALRVAGEYSVDEIAFALDMPANTVKSHLRRARVELDELGVGPSAVVDQESER